MKKLVSVYVRNSKIGPSDYYRICQYLEFIDEEYIIYDAISENEFKKNLINSGVKKNIYQAYLFFRIYLRRLKAILSDIKQNRQIIIIQREIFPHAMGRIAGFFLKKLCKGKKVIWDFDDNIFFNNEICNRERMILEKNSNVIVVTSEHLRGLLSESAQKKTILLPTTDGFCKRFDIDLYKKKRMNSYRERIELVWVGTAVNLNNIDLVINELDEAASVLKKHSKRMILNIVCNKKYECKTHSLIINNIKWSRKIAEETIINSHIGIMPLIMSEYALGKGGFKLIQYISVGLPVVASAVGYNVEIISNDMGKLIRNNDLEEWKKFIVKLSADSILYATMGEAAAYRYRKMFSYEANAIVWKKMIN